MGQTEDENRDDVSTLIALLKVATLIHKPMRDGVAEPLGLSPNELRILMALGGEGALAGYELSDMIGLPPMNVSRALDSLHRMGLVEQVADTKNRRRKPHRLSEAGWETFAATEARIAFVADFRFEGLSRKKRAKLGDLLATLDRRIGEWKTPG
jgi:DNA-binding MarR family transcriptional regulator